MITDIQSNYHTVKTEHLEACSLHYLTAGDPKNPAVLCVHGLTCVAHDFDYLADALKDQFYVIAPDMPGRGHSSHLNDPLHYDNGNYLHYCLALLEHLGISQVHWVGASMGGMIGMLGCTMYPDLIKSLMLNDVGKILSKEGLERIFQYVGQSKEAESNEAFEALLREDFVEFGVENDEIWRQVFTHRVKKDTNDRYVLRCDPTVTAPLLAQAEEMASFTDISLEDIWTPVQCPVLLHRGESSTLLSKETAESMRDDDGKDVTFHTYPNCGHMPNMMETEQTDAIRTWLLKQEA